MSSLASCIRKHGDTLNPDDIARAREIHAEMKAEGMTAREADVEAVKELFREISRTERHVVAEQIVSERGVVPKRSDGGRIDAEVDADGRQAAGTVSTQESGQLTEPGPHAEQGSTGPSAGNVESNQSQDGQATDQTGDTGGNSGADAVSNVRRGADADQGGDAADGRKGGSGESLVDAGTGGSPRGVASPDVPEHFHIENPLDIVGGGPVARFDKNKAAIETYQSLRDSGRLATDEERMTLAGYTGWGSFGQELFQGNWKHPAPKPQWVARDEWLREHLGQSEWESAQRSIINAHYTDPPTVMAMWGMLERMGFKGGRVLEPSMGIGNFFGMMPQGMKRRSQLAGIELDELTGGMAKMLYPGANISIKGYQDSLTPDNFYDLVIGNWPFYEKGPADRRYMKIDPTLHDYFFLKAIDQVRAGGLVVGITSKGSMDKVGKVARLEMAKKAELVAAFRLPSGAFKDYAGTSVVTDIIILKKRAKPLGLVSGEDWVDIVDYDTPAGTPVRLNKYYTTHRSNVLGTIDYGHGTTTMQPGLIVHRPENMQEALDTAVSKVPVGAYEPATSTDHISYVTNNLDDREGSITESPDGLFVVHGEYLAPLNDVKKYHVKSETTTRNREAELSALIKMRNLYGALVDAERHDQNADEARKEMNAAYTAFTKKHGPLNKSWGLNYMRQIGDPFYPSLASLENTVGDGKYTPAKILKESTLRTGAKVVNPTARDAYVVARNQNVNPSLDEIAKLAGKSKNAVRTELLDSGAVFLLPGGDIVPSDIYLSGNVRVKLREAEAALAEGEPMSHNIEALSKVIPKDVPYHDIEAKMGATWISPDYYKQYLAHMLNMESTEDFDLRFNAGRWSVRFPSHLNKLIEATSGFGSEYASFRRIFNAAITNQTMTIRRRDDDGTSYVDKKGTEEVNQKIANMRETFSEWVWSDPERRVDLETEYNEARNSYATPKYDGSFLGFEGMALTIGDKPFNLRQHQSDAIWRALVTRRSLNAHEVGTGKTFTIGGIAVESRRYGIAKKPLILAHNANSATVAAEIVQMYPSAKVLYIDNLSPKEIGVRLRQIANDDWDAVVMPHSLIDRLSLSEKTLMDLAAKEIAELEEEAMAAAQEEGIDLTVAQMDDPEEMKRVRAPTAKQLVKMRETILNNIRKQALRASKPGAVTFEELGVDMVLVDEAHEFKKPPMVTQMRMKGLATDTSNKSISLRFLTQYIRAQNAGGNVHLFTGTPVTNTLTEVYHQMRYIMEDEMADGMLDKWDGWFGAFASEVSDVELNAAAEYEAVTRLAAFINVPELRQMIGQYMDVVFSDDMPEMQPRRTKSGKLLSDKSLTEKERAFLLNGRTEGAEDRPYKKVIVDSADMTPSQMDQFTQLQQYARNWRNMSGKDRKEAMRNGSPESPIITEGLATKASMDVRLNDAQLVGQEGKTDDHPDSKASRAVKNVLEVYNSDKRTTQAIFTELGISTVVSRTRTDSDGNKRTTKHPVFSTANDIIERLVQGGIPREQIALVTGSTSKQKRKQIALDMNTTKIRVVIGSSKTLGVGVNMQKNLRAMHHLDAPWMPGDLEQRNGRGHRQGNQWNTVLEYRYLTDRLDGRRWQVLAVKQRFIKAFLESSGDQRSIEGEAAADEQSDILTTFSEAAGDPRVLTREKLKKKVEKFERKERLHTQSVADAIRQVRGITSFIADQNAKLPTLETATKAISKALQTNSEQFKATIDGKAHDKRADADAALVEIVTAKVRMDSPAVSVGTMYGFEAFLSHPKLSEEAVLTVNVPVGDGQFYPVSGRKANTSSIEAAMRNMGKRLENTKGEIEVSEKSLVRMKEVSAEAFRYTDDLTAARKELADLEADMDANSVPPPNWLRSGAPIDTEVIWNGRPFVVTGHRWTQENWYVMGKDAMGETPIPYTDVTDEQGINLYEEREFVPAEVLTAKDKAAPDAEQADGQEKPKLFAAGTSQTGLKAEQVRKIVAPIAAGFKNLKGVHVVQSVTDLPAEAQQEMARQGLTKVSGYRAPDNSVYLVADYIQSKAKAQKTLLHEAVGHVAIEEYMGDDLPGFLNEINLSAKIDKDIGAAARHVDRLYRNLSPGQRASEIVAKVAETAPQHSLVKRAVAALRRFLRRMGFSLPFSHTELIDVIMAARRSMEGNRAAGMAPAFRQGESGTGIDGMFSSLLRAAENLKQAKGKPAQMLAAIRKQGGVKQEEIDWTGLEDFLSTYDGSITKDEIVDYLTNSGVHVSVVTADQYDGGGIYPEHWKDRKPTQDEFDKLLSVTGFAASGKKPVLDTTLVHETDGLVDDMNGRVFVVQFGLPDAAPYYEVFYIEVYDHADGPVKTLADTPLDNLHVERRNIASENEAHIQAQEVAQENDIFAQGDDPEIMRWHDYVADDLGVSENYREIKLTLPDVKGTFENDVHFPDPNILAFLRVDDRDMRVGPLSEDKALNTYFIEEFQSDWHQVGREHGYVDQGKDTVESVSAKKHEMQIEIKRVLAENMAPEIKERAKDIWARSSAGAVEALPWDNSSRMAAEVFLRQYFMVKESIRQDMDLFLARSPAADEIQAMIAKWLPVQERLMALRYGAPEAPFKDKGWINLGLKRALLEAAGRGYEAIAWADSNTIANRWSNEYSEMYENLYDKKMPSIVKKLTGEAPIRLANDGQPYHEPSEPERIVFDSDHGGYVVLDESGEHMRRPNGDIAVYKDEGEAEDYARDELEADDIAPNGYWIIPITPELRKKVGGGLPLFQAQGTVSKLKTLPDMVDALLKRGVMPKDGNDYRLRDEVQRLAWGMDQPKDIATQLEDAAFIKLMYKRYVGGKQQFMAEESAPFRANNLSEAPATLKSVMVQTSPVKLKGRSGKEAQDYDAGKNDGDTDAAERVVDRLVKDSVIEDIRAALDPGEPVYIMPIRQMEKRGHNVIPLMYAGRIAESLNDATLVNNVYRRKGRHNTGATQTDRLLNAIEFTERDISPGQYVIVDDYYTSGVTIAAMYDYITQRGGTVKVVTSLAAGRYGKGFRPNRINIAGMLKDTGLSRVEVERIIGHELERLTDAEITLIRNRTRRSGAKGLNAIFTRPRTGVLGRKGQGSSGDLSQARENDQGSLGLFSAESSENEFDTTRTLYHGTKSEFDHFKRTGIPRNNWNSRGKINLTTDPAIASRYADRIKEGRTLIKMPDHQAEEFARNELGNEKLAQMVNRWGSYNNPFIAQFDPTGGNVRPVHIKGRGKVVDASSAIPIGADGFLWFTREENTALKEGYDWIEFENVPRRFVDDQGKLVVFDPANIRSVFDKSPAFMAEGPGSPEWMGAKSKGLDMSYRARMERAQEQGFDTDTKWYHGTALNAGEMFSGFDGETLGATTNTASAKEAFFFTNSPEVAAGFATLADRNRSYIGRHIKGYPWPQTIMPTLIKAKNPLIVDPETASNKGMHRVIAEARAAGHDGVIFKDSDDNTFWPAIRVDGKAMGVDRNAELHTSIESYKYGEMTRAEIQSELDAAVEWSVEEEKHNPDYKEETVMWRALRDAWKDDPARVTRTGVVSDVYAVFSASDIRSTNAAFDPDQSKGSNMLFMAEDRAPTAQEINQTTWYHGTGEQIAGALKPPIFLTSEDEGAEWFAVNRGDTPTIHPFRANIKKPLDVYWGDAGKKTLLDIAKKAGVVVTKDPVYEEYHASEVSENSPYNGGNIYDLAYIPAIREGLVAAGYDALTGLDQLSNDEIPVIVVLDAKSITSAFDNPGTDAFKGSRDKRLAKRLELYAEWQHIDRMPRVSDAYIAAKTGEIDKQFRAELDSRDMTVDEFNEETYQLALKEFGGKDKLDSVLGLYDQLSGNSAFLQKQIEDARADQATRGPGQVVPMFMAEDKNPGTHNGKPFWIGAFNPLDGYIEESHTYEKAEDADFHHSFYFSQSAQDHINSGEWRVFWVEEDGSIEMDWRVQGDRPAAQVMKQLRKYAGVDSGMSFMAEDGGPESPVWQEAERKGLNMSRLAREERAREQGFDTSTTYYKGSLGGLDSFRPNKSTGMIHVSTERTVAEDFSVGSLNNVYEVFVKPGRSWDWANAEDVKWLKGAVDKKQILKELADPGISDLSEYIRMNGEDEAFMSVLGGIEEGAYQSLELPHIAGLIRGHGYDSIKMREDLQTTGHNLAVFDAASIRSVNAAFGPDQTGSSNMLFMAEDESPGTAAWNSTKAKGLSMKKADRLKRARALGFDTSNVLYHGTASEIEAFETGRSGMVFFSENKAFAEDFASNFGDGDVREYFLRYTKLFDMVDNPEHKALAVRLFNEAGGWKNSVELNGAELEEDREGYDYDARYDNDWEIMDDPETDIQSELIQVHGFDAFRFIDSDSNSVTVAVTDPATIRRTDAAFDPDQAGSSNVMFMADDHIDEGLRKLGLEEPEARTLRQRFSDIINKDWLGILRRINEGVFDGLSGIMYAENEIGGFPAQYSGYVSARLATGVSDTMTAILHYGAPAWRNGVIQHKDDGTPGLLDILGDLGDDLNDWLGWMGANRAEMLMREGRENNLTEDEIRDLKTLAYGKETKFRAAKAQYNAMNTALLDLAEEAGLLDPETRSDWESEWYVPFYRMDESEDVLKAPSTKKGIANQRSTIQRLRGGTAATNDLLENILTNFTRMVEASMKNMAMLKTIDNLEGTEYLTNATLQFRKSIVPRSEIAKLIESDRDALASMAAMLGMSEGSTAIEVAGEMNAVPKEGFEKMWTASAPKAKDIISATRNGKPIYYKVNDMPLLRAITQMNSQGFQDPVTRTGRWFKRLLTTGVTSAPAFIFRNFVRDAAHAWAINKHGFTFGKDSLTGLKGALKENDLYRTLMFAGASFQGGYVHGTDPEKSSQIIRRALLKKGLTRAQADSHLKSLLDTPAKLFGTLEKGWQRYRTLGDKVENANRLATFKNSLEFNPDDDAQAIFDAKDLMDYSMRGNFAALQWFTDVTPFMNARLQGLGKLARAGRKDPKIVAWTGARIAAFSMFLAWLNGDDERYEELQDWDKDAYWHVFLGEDHYRIPKPFEIGVIFGTIPERSYHQFAGNQAPDKMLWSLQHNFFGTLGFNPVPQFAMPMVEAYANRSIYFDTPIEGMADEGKLPEARYSAYTSEIMRLLGAGTGTSPKKLEHIWDGYTGTMGAYVLATADMVAHAAMDEPSKPALRAEDLPLIKSFYRGKTKRTTQYHTDFYDRLQEVSQIYRTMRDLNKNKGRPEDARKLMNDNREKLRYRKAMKKAQKTMSKIRAQQNLVRMNRKMSPAEKRARLDELQAMSNDLAKRSVEFTDSAFQ